MIRQWPSPTVVVEEVTDPVEIARARQARMKRNWAPFEACAAKIVRLFSRPAGAGRTADIEESARAALPCPEYA